MYHMKPLSERPAESRKPLTKFYGITASESELLPLKTDRSTRTPRTTSNSGLSLPCSNSALMNSHTPKLNNRRIERHTKTGNQEKISCFFAFMFGVLKKRRIAPRKEKHNTPIFGSFRFSGGVGNERKMEKFSEISVIFALCGVVGSKGRNTPHSWQNPRRTSRGYQQKLTQRKPPLS